MVMAAMEYRFMGGSMGSVVGEKITRAAERALRAQVAADRGLRLRRRPHAGGHALADADGQDLGRPGPAARRRGCPTSRVLTDPTTGGVTASFAMLGDLNIAEPGALIGFAGPRVIEQTIRQSLPEGFQRSEFLLEHGFLDLVVQRSRDEGDARPVPEAPAVDPRRRSSPASRRWASSSAWSGRATCSRAWAIRSAASPPSSSPAPTARAPPRPSSPPWPRRAGYRTGLYTSPHLEAVEERLRIDGRTIEPGRLGAILEELVGARRARDGLAAHLLRGRHPRRLPLVRRGGGGPRGASRSASAAGWTPPTSADPILSLITPIGFDHREYLGDTLAAIAREKAGILRPGRPALVWIEDAGAGGRRCARSAARDRRRPPLRLGRGADRVGRAPGLGGAADPARDARSRARPADRPARATTRRRTWGSRCGRRRTLAGLGFDRLDAGGDRRRGRRLPLAGPAGADRAPRRPPRAPRRRPQPRRRRRPRRASSIAWGGPSTSSSACWPTRTTPRCCDLLAPRAGTSSSPRRRARAPRTRPSWPSCSERARGVDDRARPRPRPGPRPGPRRRGPGGMRLDLPDREIGRSCGAGLSLLGPPASRRQLTPF